MARKSCAEKLAIVCDIYLGAIALFFLLSTAIGIYYHYSAVPFWDMWSSYLGFYYQALDTGWLAWWEQHNEHRLVLAKIFFWIDLDIFQGRLVFLFVFNFIFSLLALATFYWALKRLLTNRQLSWPLLLALPAVFSLSWLQEENYIWAFQSQFHMAYLLPLWSFLLLSRFAETTKQSWFWSAATVGFLSIMTMANGLFALPILALMAIVLKLKLRFTIILVALTLLAYFVYFTSYAPSYGAPLLVEGLLHRLVVSVVYALKYLSGPFYQVLGAWPVMQAMMGVLYLTLFVLGLWFTLRERTQRQRQFVLQIGLLAFAFFIIATVAVTSLGRSQIGPHIPSRYMTPALLGWLSLLVVWLAYWQRHLYYRLGVYVMAVFFSALLLTTQFRALESNPLRVFVYKAAAVAAAMGIMDDPVLARVSYDHENTLRLSQLAKKDRKSIFTQDYIQAIPSAATIDLQSNAVCQYALDREVELPEAADYIRLHGWVFAQDSTAVPDYLYYVAEGEAVGYAVTGEQRPDVAKVIHPDAGYSGFQGYLSRSAVGSPLMLYGLNKKREVLCSLAL